LTIFTALLQWPESTFFTIRKNTKRRDGKVYKSYNQWLREDVSSRKKSIFVWSALMTFFSMVCGIVFLILYVNAPEVQNGLARFELVTNLSWGITVVSMLVHGSMETILRKGYKNYEREQLAELSKLFSKSQRIYFPE
jgi:hypothetical protein